MSAPKAACAAALLGLYSSVALAEQVIIVSMTDDRFDPACTSNCSLREAIHRANQTPGATRIVLRAGTYTLTLSDPLWNQEEDPDPDEDDCVRGDLDIRGELAIIGAGQGETRIQSTGVPLTGERLLHVGEGASLSLRRLTLQSGLSDTYGGALRNHGRTLVQWVRFVGNRADAGIRGHGGAIANYGDLTVSHALFENNNSRGDEGFPGRGGAIFNLGNLVVRDTTFRGNSATDQDTDFAQGGAVYNEGTATITRSTFVGNAAGLPDSQGGGAAIANLGAGVLTLSNSTVSGNSGTEINGVLSNGISREWGEPDIDARMRLLNVTIAGNDGLALSNTGRVEIINSLIAGNHLAGMPANCLNAGTYRARGLLLGTDQGNCSSDVPVDDALTWSKVLLPLADNTGSTWTHALRRGSPALDAAIGSCASYDQRGVSRPQDGDGDGAAVCDLGAYERLRP